MVYILVVVVSLMALNSGGDALALVTDVNATFRDNNLCNSTEYTDIRLRYTESNVYSKYTRYGSPFISCPTS